MKTSTLKSASALLTRASKLILVLLLGYGLIACTPKEPPPTATNQTSYTYNALGQRTSKTIDGVTTFFVYTPDGKLLAELDDTGKAIKEHLYLDNQPIAQIDKPNTTEQKTYYVHNNHLGTPKALTDESKKVVWRIQNTPFGEVTGETENLDQPVRFPGQYRDKETGYNYNYFRDYDPSLGRYIQSDPIGLEGGLNTYGYVNANPLIYTDPNGLRALSGSIGGSSIGGGLFGAAISQNQIGEAGAASAIDNGASSITSTQSSSRDCPGTPSGDPDCDEINKQVQETKRPIRNFGRGNATCRLGMSRWELLQRHVAWHDHAVARSRSIQRCWNGGDSGHQQQTADAWVHVARCGALL